MQALAMYPSCDHKMQVSCYSTNCIAINMPQIAAPRSKLSCYILPRERSALAHAKDMTPSNNKSYIDMCQYHTDTLCDAGTRHNNAFPFMRNKRYLLMKKAISYS